MRGHQNEDDPVRAAGGVVWRRTSSDELEVLLVHRPKYDDWTFPKGKLAPTEKDDEGALREVEEETGLHCRLGEELESTSYVDGRGRQKIVRYWAMTPVEGEFRPNPEVDEIRWTSVREAAAALSYDRDRDLVQSLSNALTRANP